MEGGGGREGDGGKDGCVVLTSMSSTHPHMDIQSLQLCLCDEV